MNPRSSDAAPPQPFFGRRVVHATFVMAWLGWGVGFYGPPIFLHAVMQRTGCELALVSTAVTLHFLFGALVVTQLPRLHRRFGVGPTAVAGATCAALGVIGWSLAAAPWQLFASALASGAGWVSMGAVAVNAAIAPWFVRTRPTALAKAYNGASVGGLVFSPLWVLLIEHWGFVAASCSVGALLVLVMAALSRAVFARSPEEMNQWPDGDPHAVAPGSVTTAPTRVRRSLRREARFVTLAAGMALGLFAQIGLLAHLFSLLVPLLGTHAAGLMMGFATACAMAGRLVAARCLAPGAADRRSVAALGYAVQLAGTGVLMTAGDQGTAWVLLGVALFGSGIGNATSLPPLIAQAEFAKDDVPRVVALIVAVAQAGYAFAPAALGVVLGANDGLHVGSGTDPFFLLVGVVQLLAIGCFLAGRRRVTHEELSRGSGQ